MSQKKKPNTASLVHSDIIEQVPAACGNELAAVEFIEKLRWGDSPCCAHCGSVSVYKMVDSKTGERSKRFLWRCHDCKRQYTVRIGTVLEESRIALRHWCFALWAACASKKGVSALQIKRQTGVSYKSALFLLNRIRHGFAVDHASAPKLSGMVEADETYVGGKVRKRQWHKKNPDDLRGRSVKQKTPVVAAVERGGQVRARVLPRVTSENLAQVLKDNLDPSTILVTDDWKGYRRMGRTFPRHAVVRHSYGEYVKPSEPWVHTNTVEGFFSILKRGITGVYHNVSREHLHRYVSEFEFRYNTRHLNDGERLQQAIRQCEGKRLCYKAAC